MTVKYRRKKILKPEKLMVVRPGSLKFTDHFHERFYERIYQNNPIPHYEIPEESKGHMEAHTKFLLRFNNVKKIFKWPAIDMDGSQGEIQSIFTKDNIEILMFSNCRGKNVILTIVKYDKIRFGKDSEINNKYLEMIERRKRKSELMIEKGGEVR